MEELICREGTVHSVIFQNAENGYTVLRLLTEEGEVVTVVGCIPCVAPGEHLTVTGTWEVHPQHGEQLKAQELERTLPEEEEEPPQAVALTISAKASRTLKIRFILFLLYCCVLSLAGRGGCETARIPWGELD